MDYKYGWAVQTLLLCLTHMPLAMFLNNLPTYLALYVTYRVPYPI